ncbi:MAG: putative ABC transporter permease subunit [Acetivibrionales bacterium]|jgi:ABC-2 type transport system permease protein
MKPFTAFVKMQLNVNYGISALKYRFMREKNKRWEPILVGVALIFSFTPLIALYIAFMINIFAAGVIINQPEMVLIISFACAQFMIFLFGIFYILGMFYFSKDVETLVPLPLKPYEVIGGKFAVIMVNEYLTSVPLLLPPIIIYGTGTSQGLPYWLKSAALIIVSPVIPLAVAAVIIVAIMRVANLRKHKDLFIILGGLAAMFIGIGISLLAQNFPKDPEEMRRFFTGQAGIVDLIGSRYPPAMWATKSLSESGLAGLGYILLFVVVSLLLFLLLLWLSNLMYYKAFLAGQEVGRKRRILSGIRLEKQYGSMADPAIALAIREWKILVRTPVYLLNGLVGSIIGPIIAAMMFMVRKSDPGIERFFNMAVNPDVAPYFLLGGLGLMLFTAGMNVVASTSLSREGRTIWITKMIPVPARQQVNAKLIVSFLVSAIGVAVTGIIMGLFFNLPVLWVIGAVVTGFVGSVPMIALSLLIDVFHPKLVWNSETEAMKQNMNGALGMLASILVLAILGAVTGVLLALRMKVIVVLIAINIVSIISGILSVMVLYAVAARKYRELEA